MYAHKRPLTIATSVKDRAKAFDDWTKSKEKHCIKQTTSQGLLHDTGNQIRVQTVEYRDNKYKSENNLQQAYSAPKKYPKPIDQQLKLLTADNRSLSTPHCDAAFGSVNNRDRPKSVYSLQHYNSDHFNRNSSFGNNTFQDKHNGNGSMSDVHEQVFSGSTKNIEYLVSNKDISYANTEPDFRTSKQTGNKEERNIRLSENAAREETITYNAASKSNVFRQRAPSSESGKELALLSRSRTSLHSSNSSKLHEIGNPNNSRSHKRTRSRNATSVGSKENLPYTNTTNNDVNIESAKSSNQVPKQCRDTRMRAPNSSSGVTGSNISLPKSDAAQHERAIEQFVSDTKMQTGSNTACMISSVSEPTLYSSDRRLQTKGFIRTIEHGCEESKSMVQLKDCSNVSLSFAPGSISGDPSRTLHSSTSQQSIVSGDQSVIRHNILDTTKERLEEHRRNNECEHQRDSESDFKSRRYKMAKKILDKRGLLILTCHEGDGSTHLGYDLMDAYTDVDRFILLEASEWKKCINAREKSIVMVDDTFGRSEVDTKEVDKWPKIIERNSGNIAKTIVKVIFIIKHSMARHCQEFLSAKKDCIVDLSDPNLQLNKEEKLDILTKRMQCDSHEHKIKICYTAEDETISHTGSRTGKYIFIYKHTLSEIANVALPTGFPKQVQLFLGARDYISQGAKFFIKPLKYLYEKIHSWKNSKSDEDVDKYLALIATLAYNGQLKSKHINDLRRQFDTHLSKSMEPNAKDFTACVKQLKSETSDSSNSENIDSKKWQHFLPDLASKLQCRGNIGQRVENGAKLLNGTYLTINRRTYEFSAPCIEVAITLSCSELFTQDIVKGCKSDIFFEYVGTDVGFKVDESRCIRLNSADKNSCDAAVNRLKRTVLTGNVEQFVTHALMRDQTFVDIFFKAIKKERTLTSQILSMTNKTTNRSLISHGLDNFFFAPGDTNNIAEMILTNKKWFQKRKENKEWTCEQERQVMEHCCEHGMNDTYFYLVETLRVPITRNCLMPAIKSGAVNIVKDILSTKPSPLTKEDLCRAMLEACRVYARKTMHGGKIIIKVLSEQISIDYKVNNIESIVHFAGRTSNVRLLEVLKMFKGDINLVNEDRQTCIHLATISDHPGFIEVALKQFDADQYRHDRNGLLPVHVAAELDKLNVLERLYDIDKAIIHVTDKKGRQPLHISAINYSKEVSRFLISRGAGVNELDGNHQTPLHHAAKSGKAEVIHFLLNADADVNAEDIDGNTPLALLCKTSNEKGLKRLMNDKHKIMNFKLKTECLFIAVEKGNRETLKILVENGMDVNVINCNGNTVLHSAMERHGTMVVPLIEMGARVSTPTNKVFPIHLAARRGDVGLLDLILEAGAMISETTIDTRDTILHIATSRGKVCVVEHILQKTHGETLIDYRNIKGETTLHISAKSGHLAITKCLLDHGASTSVITNAAQTPLQLLEVEMRAARERAHMKRVEEYIKVRNLLLRKPVNTSLVALLKESTV